MVAFDLEQKMDVIQELEKCLDLDPSSNSVTELIAEYPYFHILYLLQSLKEEAMHSIRSEASLMTPVPVYTYYLSNPILATNIVEDKPKHNQDDTLSVDVNSNSMDEIEKKKNSRIDKKRQPRQAVQKKASKVKVTENQNAVESLVNETVFIESSSEGLPPKTTTSSAAPKNQGQIKTFMEWLAEMNSLSPVERMTKMRLMGEVIKDSKASINKHNIITESMAQVWLEQGLPRRAIKVYEKLSLLFVDKSSYFAKKIADIKVQYHL